MVVYSLLWMRRLSYEIFLIGHMIMALFTVVGSWHHLVLRFGQPGSHEYWLYAAFAVWAYDRRARVYRIVNNGDRRATITDIGANHIPVEVPDIKFHGRAGYHGYVYFLTVHPWRPWENHPFSITSTALLHPVQRLLPQVPNSPQNDSPKLDAKGSTEFDAKSSAAHVVGPLSTITGITLYVRKSTGVTKQLQK